MATHRCKYQTILRKYNEHPTAIGGTRLQPAGGKTLTPTFTLVPCLLGVEMRTLITMLESPFCFAPDCSSSEYWPSGKSRPVRQIKAVITCMASGMRKVRRQDKSIFLFVNAIIMLKMTGVRAFVTPPPRLPQPAAVALAAPTFRDPEALLVQKLRNQVSCCARLQPLDLHPMKLSWISVRVCLSKPWHGPTSNWSQSDRLSSLCNSSTERDTACHKQSRFASYNRASFWMLEALRVA